MNNRDWKMFFLTCADVLGPGDSLPFRSESWCSWTTFSRLRSDAGYWQRGLPGRADISEEWIGDGGVWGQPFAYADIAHIIIPREFHWQKISQGALDEGVRQQDIDVLSSELDKHAIVHRKTDLVLEMKFY